MKRLRELAAAVTGMALLCGGVMSLTMDATASQVGTTVAARDADQLYGAGVCQWWDYVSSGCGRGSCAASCSYYQLDGWFTIADAYGEMRQGNCGQDPYGECGVYQNIDVPSCSGGSSY